MAKRLIINMGFITNSSSAIHWFPKEVLDDPDVKTFMEAYGLTGGYVGDDLWSRDTCESVLLNAAQHDQARTDLNSGYGDGDAGDRLVGNGADGGITIIYGDEYESVTSELAHLLSAVAHKKGLSHGQNEYN